MPNNYGNTNNIVDTFQIDAADVKVPIDDIDDALYNALHGETPQFNQLRFEADTTLTIDSVTEAITINQTYHKVANFGAASIDTLKDILGYNEGDVLILQPDNTANVTIVQHNGGGAGNIRLANKQNFYLTGQRMLMLVQDGTYWYQINGPFGDRHPRFHVRKSGTQVLSAATPAKVTWETEDEDTGSYFDLATERFTPLLAGFYRFHVLLRHSALTDGDAVRTSFYVNGTEITQKLDYAPATAAHSFEHVYERYFNGTTDYIEVFAESSAGSTIQNSSVHTYWKGWLEYGIEES